MIFKSKSNFKMIKALNIKTGSVRPAVRQGWKIKGLVREMAGLLKSFTVNALSIISKSFLLF